MSTQLGRTTVEDGTPADMILVIAETHHRFAEWCKRNGVNPQGHNIRYVWTLSRLDGINNALYADLGSTDQELNRAVRLLKSIGHITPLFVKE